MRDTVAGVTVTDLLPETAGEASVMQRIGVLVRDARRHRGLTQLQLAERLGTSQSAVARIEQGGQNLTLDLLGRLSAALGSELTRSVSRRAGTVVAPSVSILPGTQ